MAADASGNRGQLPDPMARLHPPAVSEKLVPVFTPLLAHGKMSRHHGEAGAGSGVPGSASSSADTPAASAAPIRCKIASA